MELAFKTKKAAGDAGSRTQKKWFAAFFTPKPGEQPVVVKEQRFFFDRKINDKKITRTMFLPLIFLSNPILQLNEVRGRT